MDLTLLSMMPDTLPYKISALIFVRDEAGRFLMLKRNKSPNKGRWSPIGGKLEMSIGESPYECARREVHEEIGLKLKDEDLKLFAYVAEKSYEGSGHWLLFLFDCNVQLKELPPPIDEGHFAFFTRTEIDTIALPDSDNRLVWPYYDKHRNGFVGLRADCSPGGKLNLTEELKLV